MATPSKSTSGGDYSLAIPALGLSGTIRDLSGCGTALPDTGIWSWGCSGQDNLFLLAHAYGAFAPIYLGYHSGALRTGLAATYIDPSGGQHAYYIAEIWNLPLAQAYSGWAWVSEQSPVITLVTCNDPDSSYRIIVRLIPVGTTNPDPTLSPPPVRAPAPTASPTPTQAPTPTPTPVPTASPTPTATIPPTPSPTASPSPTPVITPTPQIIASPTPEPSPTTSA